MRKSTKTIQKNLTYVIELPDGTKMVPGSGNVRTSHKGVPAKDFLKALKKAVKAASEAGVIDSKDDEIYGNRSTSASR